MEKFGSKRSDLRRGIMASFSKDKIGNQTYEEVAKRMIKSANPNSPIEK